MSLAWELKILLELIINRLHHTEATFYFWYIGCRQSQAIPLLYKDYSLFTYHYNDLFIFLFPTDTWPARIQSLAHTEHSHWVRLCCKGATCHPLSNTLRADAIRIPILQMMKLSPREVT